MKVVREIQELSVGLAFTHSASELLYKKKQDLSQENNVSLDFSVTLSTSNTRHLVILH